MRLLPYTVLDTFGRGLSMLLTLSVFLLAIAVSLDSFTVGFTYGLRCMYLPLRSLIIIASCTATSLTIALTIGHFITKIFSPDFAESLGGYMLILIGLAVIYQYFKSEQQNNNEPKTILNIEIKSLGLVINILRKPLIADFDRSGSITGIEALFLGIALSLDAFAVGVSAAMLRYSPLLLVFSVTLMSSAFVLLGINSGQKFSKHLWIKKMSFLPGVLLILLGIFKM